MTLRSGPVYLVSTYNYIILGAHMAKVTPWYSAIGGVYHDNTACSDGQTVAMEHLRAGTGKRPLCETCEKFDADEARKDSIDATAKEPGQE